MRRGFVALLLAATFFAACSSFDGDSEPRTPAPDAEADTSVPPDRGDGGPSDAGPDARGLSFCVQRPDALFCDDFEQPNRTFTTAEPWDALSGNRANVMSIGRPGFASPSALRIKGALGDGEGRGLQKILPLDGRKIRWSFRLLVARLDQRADAGAPQVSIAAFQFANDKYLVYALFRHAGDLRGIAAWNLTGDAGPALFANPPVGLRLGDWMAVRVEYEPMSGTDEFRLYVGAEQLSKLRLDPGQSSTVALGVHGRGPGGIVDVAYDDVVVETF